MSFRVKFTDDKEWPILYDDDFVPLQGKAKGFRIYRCDATTLKIVRNSECEAVDGFWVDAVSAITDAEGIVHFE